MLYPLSHRILWCSRLCLTFCLSFSQPRPKYFHSAAILDGVMIVYGGRSNTTDQLFSSELLLYNIKCNYWYLLPGKQNILFNWTASVQKPALGTCHPKKKVLSRKICKFIWKLDRNLTFVRLGPHEQILGLFVKFTITFLSVRIGRYRKSSIKPPSQTSPLPLISAPFSEEES